MKSWKNQPIFSAGFKRSSFAEAITATSSSITDDGTGIYTADLKRDWCIGFIPHGGYLSSLLISTCTTHITTHPKLSPLNQPHPIHISTSFFNACTPGPATVSITPVKTGRAFTYLRAILSQSEGTRRCLEATLIFTHLDTLHDGPTLPTVSPLPAGGIPHRERDCVQWQIKKDPLADVRPVARKLVYMMPRGKLHGSSEEARSVREQWVSLGDGGMMGVEALGYLSDMYLPLPENYPQTAKTHWYPTLSLAIEIKRVPPPQGWKWLFCRIESREIRNGRMDVGVDIFDEEGQLVAVAHQLAIIVSSDRNKPRNVGAEKPKL